MVRCPLRLWACQLVQSVCSSLTKQACVMLRLCGKGHCCWFLTKLVGRLIQSTQRSTIFMPTPILVVRREGASVNNLRSFRTAVAAAPSLLDTVSGHRRGRCAVTEWSRERESACRPARIECSQRIVLSSEHGLKKRTLAEMQRCREVERSRR